MPTSYTNFVQNGTVTVNAQPNITSVGTLTSLNCSGNVNFTGSNVSLGNVANVKIGGGANRYGLQTDGAGNLKWTYTTEIFFNDFDVPTDGTPVYANSTTVRAVPLIYIGTDPGANYIWPYYQNTATIANGYLANSTAAWTPANAAILNGNGLANTIIGDWYRLTDVTNWNSNIAPNVILSKTLTVYCYGNVANIAFQVVPFVGYSSNNDVYLNTARISTSYTDNIEPKTSVVTVTNTYRPDLQNLPGTGNFTLAGYYIRNITANSELTVYASSFRLELNT